MFKILQITFIFDRCHHSLAAVTTVKYEQDIQRVTIVFLIITKSGENIVREETGLVTPITGHQQP